MRVLGWPEVVWAAFLPLAFLDAVVGTDKGGLDDGERDELLYRSDAGIIDMHRWRSALAEEKEGERMVVAVWTPGESGSVPPASGALRLDAARES